MHDKKEQRMERLVWIDLEMSGLNPDADVILEAAVIVTDLRFELIKEWEPWVVHQPDSVLDNMDLWNTETHTQSGLISRCRQSADSAADVERKVINALKNYVNKRESPICGNSICQDRRFLARHMPALEDYFHYRNLDVSSFKIIANMYYPALAQQIKGKKPATHKALDDIRASIEEMRFYCRNMLVPPQ